MKLFVTAGAFVLVAAAACAPVPSPTTAAVSAEGPRQCFFADQVQNFEVVDSRTVNIRVNVDDVYRLTLFTPCSEANFSETIALRSRGGTNSVCGPLDAELIAPSPTGPRTCPIDSITRLTAAEVAALPPRDRP